jgi:hypothetical protein
MLLLQIEVELNLLLLKSYSMRPDTGLYLHHSTLCRLLRVLLFLRLFRMLQIVLVLRY